MTDLTQEKKHKKMSKMLWIVYTIIGIIVGITIIITFIYPKIQNIFPPQFNFEYEGFKESYKPTYEVTEELFYERPWLQSFQISVNSNYRGNKIIGPVIIKIVSASGKSYEVSKWQDFQNTPRASLSFYLKPSDLFTFSGVPVKAFTAPTQVFPSEDMTGKFNIEVITLGGKKLASRSIVVVNTPWFSSVQLSDCAILAGEQITAYITLKNVGLPSKFKVIGLLYNTTSINVNTLACGDEGWWPGKSWGTIIFEAWHVTEKKIDTNKEYTFKLVIPQKYFKTNNTYVFETYTVKDLPYLKFTDGDWSNSENSWVGREQPHYSTIVVLAP